MAEENPPLDPYRTGYIAGRWDVTDNAAKALQLFEIGFTVSGAAGHLPVTKGTVARYHSTLMEKIHEDVVFPVTESKRRFDIFGDFNGETYEEGYALGKQNRLEIENGKVTDRQSQLDPRFRDTERDRNEGGPLSEMDFTPEQ